jgi:DNA invertase Pin-like site-specific DNA recombinase
MNTPSFPRKKRTADRSVNIVSESFENVVTYIRIDTAQTPIPLIDPVLADQSGKLRNYAFSLGVSTVTEFFDVASGMHVDRPGLTKLMSAARAGEVDLIIVATLDRLSRDTHDALALMRFFQELGVRVISADGSVEGTGNLSPSLELFFTGRHKTTRR